MVHVIVLWEDYVGDGGGRVQCHMIIEVSCLAPDIIRKAIERELGYTQSHWDWFTVYHLGPQVNIEVD